MPFSAGDMISSWEWKVEVRVIWLNTYSSSLYVYCFPSTWEHRFFGCGFDSVTYSCLGCGSQPCFPPFLYIFPNVLEFPASDITQLIPPGSASTLNLLLGLERTAKRRSNAVFGKLLHYGKCNWDVCKAQIAIIFIWSLRDDRGMLQSEIRQLLQILLASPVFHVVPDSIKLSPAPASMKNQGRFQQIYGKLDNSVLRKHRCIIPHPESPHAKGKLLNAHAVKYFTDPPHFYKDALQSAI